MISCSAMQCMPRRCPFGALHCAAPLLHHWCCTRLLHAGEQQLQMHTGLVHTNKHQVSLLHSITKYQLTEGCPSPISFQNGCMYCVDVWISSFMLWRLQFCPISKTTKFNWLMSELLALSGNYSMESFSNYIYCFAVCISRFIKLTIMWFYLYCLIFIWMPVGDIHFSPSYYIYKQTWLISLAALKPLIIHSTIFVWFISVILFLTQR